MLLTTGLQLETPKVQREYLERLVEHDIAALGFGTGFRHRKRPGGARRRPRAERDFPLFEVPYELPFIAITERAFARLLDERYELLQRNMVGDLLAEALSGHLYPEDLQARLQPFGIGERIAVLAFALEDASSAAGGGRSAARRRAGREPRRDPRRPGLRGGRRGRGTPGRRTGRAGRARARRARCRASARCAPRPAARGRRTRCA